MAAEHFSTSFSSCFFPTNPHLQPPSPPPHPPTPTSQNPNLTTTLYHTDFGLAALTWCRHLLGRSLHVDLRFHNLSSSFHLYMKPFLFWRKQGSKKLRLKSSQTKLEVHWDLTKAKFLSNPEPQSGFFIAIVVNNEMTLLVGDSASEAYSRTRARTPERPQDLILRREHVFGDKLYTTKARFGGKTRDISIDCTMDGEEPKLCFSVDNKRVLQVKRLRWKFRGNEKIEVDGVPVQVSWDVFNWLFDDVEDGHAVFMFRFEEEGEEVELKSNEYLGMNGFERRKLKKNSFKNRSSSSSSMSSGSSVCSSSVMEWASMEENELHTQTGFSLLVYAWKI